MDKRLMAFLKDRKIFNSGGNKKSLKEALSAMEMKTEYKDRARKVIKKARAK
jgi:hypothetical protein